MDKHVIEISWASLWRILLFVIFVAVLYLGRQVLLGLFLALVISSGLDFPVDFLEEHRIPRTLGVIIVFLASALILIIIAYRVVPFLILDLNTIFAGINHSSATRWLEPFVSFEQNQSFQLFFSHLSTQLFSGTVSPLSTLSDLFGSLGLAVAVLVSSFYLSLSHDGVDRFIRAVMPQNYEDATLRIYHRSRRKIGFWFRTQLLLSCVMGGSTWLALTLLGVDHAFLIGILAAIFELVPFVGPILSGTVAVIAAFGTSTALALYTLIVFLVLHQIEANVMVPLLTKRAVDLHPVIVITALIMGIEIGGFLGAIVAVPLAAVFQEIIEDWSRNKRVAPAPSPPGV